MALPWKTRGSFSVGTRLTLFPCIYEVLRKCALNFLNRNTGISELGIAKPEAKLKARVYAGGIKVSVINEKAVAQVNTDALVEKFANCSPLRIIDLQETCLIEYTVGEHLCWIVIGAHCDCVG